MGPYKKCFYLLCSTIGLCGCEAPPTPELEKPTYFQTNSSQQRVIQQAMCHIRRDEIKPASRTVNLALQDFPKEPALHLLNGLIYEELSEKGEEGSRELAFIAYQTALSLDSTNWYALYRAALIRLTDNDYLTAQELFARAALLKPNNPDVLYGLAMASYYAHDLEASRLAIEQALRHLKGDNPLFMRAAALIFAATGQQEKSKQYFDQLKKKLPQNDSEVVNLQERMDRWTSLYQKKLYRTVAGDASGGSAATPQNTSSENVEIKSDQDEVVVFDCYILKISESVTNTKGLNLFQQGVTQSLTSLTNPLLLTLKPQGIAYQFGGTPGATTTKSIAWNPIIYNLNIMNVIDDRVEVLGRPTLSTFLKVQATFSSGNYYSSGISGSAGGSLINIPTGIIMTLMPTKIEGDMVTVDVEIESTVPDTVNTSTAFTSQIILLLKTKMDTTMQLKFNETGMIGGDYQRQSTYKKDGFPILEDLPLIQFLTSQERSFYQKSSALFLITPRRPESMKQMSKDKVNLRRQRANLPSLTQWLHGQEELKDRDPVFALIVDELFPRNATQYYRRGDVLPIADHALTSMKEENSSWRSFLYY